MNTAPISLVPPTKRIERDYLHPDVVADRLKLGRIAEYTHGTLPPGTLERGAPSYFRSYVQVKEALSALETAYPDLVEVIDIGDSSEKVSGSADRDILLLRITAKGINEGQKPTAFHIAGEHAREIANPELTLRHAKELLAGYGTDPEATALLQTRVIEIVPMMNPDGHAVVERGYAQAKSGNLMHRKNTSAPAGTDLNRNYDFHWGGSGASTNPRSDTYRGSAPASEPEVQAIQQRVSAVKPGIMIDWHSYSELNLYPWGDTKSPTPDHAGLDALARKFSTWNGYTPQQSIKLYPTTGTSKDWAYGTHRIPGFTIETGRTFHQSDAEFERVWGENKPIFSYVAKIADAPLSRVYGPEVGADIVTKAVSADSANSTGQASDNTANKDTFALSVSALVSDINNGGQALAGAELVLDPFAAPGTGITMSAADGAFDSATENVVARISLDRTRSSDEPQLIHLRGRDVNGNWGPLTAQWIKPEDHTS